MLFFNLLHANRKWTMLYEFIFVPSSKLNVESTLRLSVRQIKLNDFVYILRNYNISTNYISS